MATLLNPTLLFPMRILEGGLVSKALAIVKPQYTLGTGVYLAIYH